MAEIRSLDDILNTVTDNGTKGKKGKKAAAEPVRVLTDEHKQAIRALVANKLRLKDDQDAIKDDTKAIADKLGLKTSQVGEIVSMVMAEEAEGGKIQDKSLVIELAEQVLDRDPGEA